MAVYWIGQDGNAWVKGDDGQVRNMGHADAGSDDGQVRVYREGYGNLNIAATRIDDPNPGNPGATQQTTSAPTGGGSAAPKVLDQAAVNNTQRAIDQIPGLLEAALADERQNYNNTVNDFNSQETGQRKTYDESSTTNQKNYDQNFMASILAGIKGLGGLMSILRGTGAGGGTAEEMARDTVGGVTATDIREGADTRNENQTALDASLSTFLTDLGRKRRANEDTFTNNERSIRRDSNTSLQDLFGKMAGYYGDADRTAERENYMRMAGDLTPSIAADSQRRVSAYDTTPVNVKAPELSAFADPTQPSVVAANPGQVGSGIFTISDRRRREQAPAGV